MDYGVEGKSNEEEYEKTVNTFIALLLQTIHHHHRFKAEKKVFLLNLTYTLINIAISLYIKLYS